MSYRFIRITDYYQGFLDAYFEKNPLYNDLSYDELYENITDQSIEIVSSYGKHLRFLGVEAIDIISNATGLQKKWAAENCFKADLSNEAIVLAQLKKYQPDVIWIDTTKFLTSEWIELIKSELAGIKKIVGHICAPYNYLHLEALRKLDLVFTCTPCMLEELKKLGINRVECIYHSFDPMVIEKLAKEENHIPISNLLFTGSLLTGYGLHKNRIDYLEEFINNNINITLYGNVESKKRIFLKKALSKTIRSLNHFKLNYLVNTMPVLNKYKLHAQSEINYYSNELLSRVQSPVFGLEMYKVLEKSNICFNIHGDIAKGCAGNLRLFEATGVGVCLLTDWKQNISELFDPENEVVTYRSMDECVEKIKWLDEHPLERKKIGEAGQRRTLIDHTVEKRAKKVDFILSNLLKI
jgi:spore maturation protein CgeB